MTPAAAGWRLTVDRLLWLTAALALVVAPHVPRVPLWVSGAYGLLALWRLAAALRGTPLPGAVVRLLLQVVLVAGVYLEYGTIMGRTAGVTLLIALVGMKLLETRSQRDAFIGVLLAYFLVITNFLYSQSIPTGVYMFVTVVVITATLARLQTEAHQLDARGSLALGGGLVLQALPLMLVLFLLFPRIPGPLWGLPEDAANAVTGLSDTMSPGDISRLSQSDAVAFRVDFEGEPPAPEGLYWRGPVMWDTDGRRWSVGDALELEPPPVVHGEAVTRYSVTLEPHDQRWLFLLDLPLELPPDSTLSAGLVAKRAKPVRERMRYAAASSLDYRVESVHPVALQRALELPPGEHPRARALAREWSDRLGDPRQVVREALAYFAGGGFSYTLRPPQLPADPVDQFLFETRAGFCEHYATSFAVLMRAAGIPARVVAGYQGGEPNPLDDYWIVRQRDAHAWNEVWLADTGWVRVDPTAAVAPDRVEQGMDSALPPERPALIGLGGEGSERLYALLDRLRYSWDAVNNWWNQWVLGYGRERQRDLLSRLGIDAEDWRELGLWLVAMVALALGAAALWLLLAARARRDRARRLYDRLCRKLKRRGIACAPAEGPLDLARRAGRALPAARPELEAIVADYVAARYGRGADLDALAHRIRRFRP